MSTLRVLVDDPSAVLAHFALMLNRRRVELVALSVHRLDNPATVVLLVELDASPGVLDHLTRRLAKLINVIEVGELAADRRWAECPSESAQLCTVQGA